MLTDGMTQEEVAEVMGIKRQAVNNIEKLALRKLKYIIARKYTKGDLL
jgi:DNA-binding XRE family transcriptional regulator